MSEEISENLKKCLDAYRALSKQERTDFFLEIQEDELNEIRNAPVDLQEVADAVSDFKSLTLKVKSSWYENQIDTYKIVKKKSGWEYTHKDNHGSVDPVVIIIDESAEQMMKNAFELGVLNWDKPVFWNNCYTDSGIWTLDMTFKKRPKVHMKFDGDFPDKWFEFTNLITEDEVV